MTSIFIGIDPAFENDRASLVILSDGKIAAWQDVSTETKNSSSYRYEFTKDANGNTVGNLVTRKD